MGKTNVIQPANLGYGRSASVLFVTLEHCNMISAITTFLLIVGIVYGANNDGTYTQEELEAALQRYEQKTGTTHATNHPTRNADLSLNMQNVPLEHAARTFEGITQKIILIDSNLTAGITIQPETWLTREEALNLFAESLARHGLKLVAIDDNTLKITKKIPNNALIETRKPHP